MNAPAMQQEQKDLKDLKKISAKVIERLYYCFKGQVADLEAELEANKLKQPPSSKKPKLESPVTSSMVEELCKEAAEVKEEAAAADVPADPESKQRMERMDSVLERLNYIAEKLKYLEARAMEDKYDYLEALRVLRSVAEERQEMKEGNVLEDKEAADFLEFLDKPLLQNAKRVWYDQYLEQRKLSSAIAEANFTRKELQIRWKYYNGLLSLQTMPWENALEEAAHTVVEVLEQWEPLQDLASKLTIKVLHTPGDDDKKKYAEAVETIWREAFQFKDEKLKEFPAAEIGDFWGTWSELRKYFRWSVAAYQKGKQWGLK